MKVVPEAWLKCMSPEDRKAMGKAGMTAEEAIAKFTAKNERQLQSQIVNLLRLKGIEVCWHRTDKKSAATVGWPDLTFAVLWTGFGTIACAWEIKMPDGKLSEEQTKTAIRMQRGVNNWTYRVIRSVDEALKELRAMGIK